MKRAYGTVTAAIERSLINEGALTRAELGRKTGIECDHLSNVLSRMHKLQRVHVVAYVQDDGPHHRLYPRAVYEWGPGPDARKPKPLTHAQRTKRYRQLKRKKVTSVFDLGKALHPRMKPL